MLYILVTAIVFCALLCTAELLGRAADRMGVMDRLFRLFDLLESDPTEKESAPAAGTAQGTKVIYIDNIITRRGEAVKEEVK